MRSFIRPISAAVCIAVVCAATCGCGREAKPPPPPTPEKVRAGVEQSAQRVRDNPNLTPKQKEQALRLLEGIKASAQQQQRPDGE